MQAATYRLTIFFLTLGGVLFSGYLSAQKFFTRNCAFSEPCPYFLGHPACYYGFGIFALMFLLAVLALFDLVAVRSAKLYVGILSLVGTIFAGGFVVVEILKRLHWALPVSYSLGLPTCAYGLIFYLLIFILSLVRTK